MTHRERFALPRSNVPHHKLYVLQERRFVKARGAYSWQDIKAYDDYSTAKRESHNSLRLARVAIARNFRTLNWTGFRTWLAGTLRGTPTPSGSE